jgi:Trk K+ transport system NAD-binding subunit
MSNEEPVLLETPQESIEPATSMIMRRMRAPLLFLITVYSIAILGLILIPGVDNEGNPWHMSLFHAFYYVSFTATTIGFGEIPYALNDAQRMWVLCTIYMTVISWLYAIGTILSLVQDPLFRRTREESRFKRQAKKIRDPFYLVCGLGETGYEVVKALTDEHYHAIVIEKDASGLLNNLHSLQEFVPYLIADASIPRYLEMAGISSNCCNGVIAATASDETNLKIAISSKLLHPGMKVICRSDLREYEENMLSFKTDFVINPYRTFADIFSMLLHSSSLHLIFDWLTGAPSSQITDEPLNIKYGRWILCSYGRFGQALYQKLLEHDVETVILEPIDETCEAFKQENVDQAADIIKGTGIDEHSLLKADIKNAVGIIAGTNDDSNNLSIIMTARQLNPNIFVIGRQNQRANTELFKRTRANLVMQPREITARMIRSLFLNPLLIEFLKRAQNQEEDWMNIAVSRLSAVIGERKPQVWTIKINKKMAPAIIKARSLGRAISLSSITQDPASQKHKLKCVPLLLKRKGHYNLMPDDTTLIEHGDRILFCGMRSAMNSMHWTLKTMNSLNYVMTFENEPESFIWRKISRRYKGQERRESRR